MTLTSKEHYELMGHFERLHKGLRLDREEKHLWPIGQIYQNGEANALFIAFRHGYTLGQVVERIG